jgi:hypothetical protein
MQYWVSRSIEYKNKTKAFYGNIRRPCFFINATAFYEVSKFRKVEKGGDF